MKKTTPPGPPALPVVRVVWRDACSEEAAEPHVEAVSGLAELTEVGFLIAESEESISLAMELYEGAAGRWRLHIPKSCILSQEILTPSRRGKR